MNFESTDKGDLGNDNTFQKVGIGASERFLKIQPIQVIGCSSIGFLLTRSGTNLPNRRIGNMPSSVNLTVGCRDEWHASKHFALFIESSLLNSIKLNSDEETRIELYALRLGILVR